MMKTNFSLLFYMKKQKNYTKGIALSASALPLTAKGLNLQLAGHVNQTTGIANLEGQSVQKRIPDH